MKQMGKKTRAFTAILFFIAILLPAFPLNAAARPLGSHATIPQYTVTFDPGIHGTFDPEGAPAIQTVPHGEGATPPTVTAEKAYNFTGWDKPYDNITRDTTVTAQYAIKTFTVRFEAGEHGAFAKGAKTVQTVPYGNAATAPAVDPEEGYDFTGWDRKYDHVTGNMTVTACYSLKTYTVTFDLGEHGKQTQTSAPLIQQVPYGGKATAPEVTPEDGYIFTGWDNTFDRITTDATVKAIYEAEEYTVSVRIQGNGRVTGIQGIYGYGTVIELPMNAPAPGEGYAFVDFEDANGNPISQVKVTQDMSIVAVFRETGTPQATRQINEEQVPLAQNQTFTYLLSSTYPYFIAGFIALVLLILFIILPARRKHAREETQPRYSRRFPIYRMLYRKKGEKK